MSNKEDFKIDQEYEVIERMIDCNDVNNGVLIGLSPIIAIINDIPVGDKID